MNEDYKSIEPGTDLGLGLGYTDQYVQGRLTNKSGVGANAAGSMVDVKYVTTDSLSELVWSPHKGLSLRCADSSFNNRKNSILWDAAASNASFALPQSAIAEKSTSNDLLDNRTILLSQAESHLKNISEGKQTSNGTSSGDAACMTSEVQMHKLEKGVGSYASETVSRAEVSAVCFKWGNLQATGGVDITDAGNIPVNEVLTIRKNECSYLPVDVNRINEVSMKQDELELNKVQHELLDMGLNVGDINEDRNITAGKDVLQPMNVFEPTVSHPTILEKLESSAENDLQTINDKKVGCEGNKIVVTAADSSHEVRGSNQQDEKDNCKDRGDSASPTNSGMHWIQRKGKEKALSDGDVHGRMLNTEDNSYGSVESCSSAFLSTSKRRWSFEQQGNKRIKKQVDKTSGPTSNFGQDSSFMSWISNMMKGFPESIQDEAASLDLTLAKRDAEHGGLNEEPTNKKMAPGFSGIGFQSIFQSLYNPIMRGEEGAPSAACQSKQEAKEIEVIKKSCDLNATPIACFGESDNFGKPLLLNNENATEFISGNGAALLIQLKNSPEISCDSRQSHKNRSQENRNSCNLASGAETGEVKHNPALVKCKSNSTENADCDLPCGKNNPTAGNTSDPLKNLWISRFAPKTSVLMENPETCNLDTKDDSQCSIQSARLIPCPQNHIDRHSMDDLDTAVSKEQCNSANTETSPSRKELKSHTEQKSISKFKSILRSPKLTSSEAMASVFARRLGALKHIIPSDLTINVGHETVTCFFCGTRGHNLHNCSEITEREIEDLSRNIRLCNETVDPPCSCIRCFQLNHWAIACPHVPSRGQQQSESHAALADRYDTGELPLTSRIGASAKPQHTEDRKMDGVASMLDDTDDPNIKTDLRLDCKVADEVKPAAISIPKCVIPRFSEKSSKGNEKIHVDSFIEGQNSNVQQVVFNAVKKLQISRSNILKCMDSRMSLSHLDGFFLRIRLGKWEEGLGGTGYHVACIRGAQLAKNSISVIVRGVECQVRSQYISNHDFLEDELRAWWCTASKDGSRVLPLAADLRAKVKKKKELGF